MTARKRYGYQKCRKDTFVLRRTRYASGMNTRSECVRKHSIGRYDQNGLYVQSGKSSAPTAPGIMRMSEISAKKDCTFPRVNDAARLTTKPRLQRCSGRKPRMSPPSLTRRISWMISPASARTERTHITAEAFFPELFRRKRSPAVTAKAMTMSMPTCSGQKCENESMAECAFFCNSNHFSTSFGVFCAFPRIEKPFIYNIIVSN